MTLARHIQHVFREKFNSEPWMYKAPGRINLIGEHTDYNEGFVMPAAVDQAMVFAVCPSGDNQCSIYAADLDEMIVFSIFDLKPGRAWYNYLMGVTDGLLQKNSFGGVNCVLGSNIPPGAGLSSSAALCCGFGFALNEIFQLGLGKLEIALIAQRAEHRFAHLMCGIMDQYASLFGKKDQAFILDCRHLKHEYLPMPASGYELMLIDTKVKHYLGSSSYNERRQACEAGVNEVSKIYSSVKALRDVSIDMLDQVRNKLDPEVFIQCGFIIAEIERARQGAAVLLRGDILSFGKLMYQTHWGLSKEFKISCDESDLLVEIAQEDLKTVAGARQMGGGFGGCTINLVKKTEIDKFKLKVQKKYFTTFKTEPEFYPVALSEGVSRIDAE